VVGVEPTFYGCVVKFRAEDGETYVAIVFPVEKLESAIRRRLKMTKLPVKVAEQMRRYNPLVGKKVKIKNK